MKNNQQISVNTITDYHLESFLRCPYHFYYQHILSVNSKKVKWRQAVQSIINQTVKRYYQLAEPDQTTFNILKLLDGYWKNVSVQLFDSKLHYYTVLATTTDHLLQLLSRNKKQEQPLFLFEKHTTYIDELETHLSLTIELAEWSSDSFIIKKYLVESDEELLKLYSYLMIVFSHKAFGKLPEKLEIINLLKGEINKYSPTVNDVSKGLLYLQHMKNLLKDPNDYTKTTTLAECEKCPFSQLCETRSINFEDQTDVEFFH